MHHSYLTFCLQGAWYAVEAKRVREILRLPALTPITEAPHYILGVVNYRGHILPVMDLGIRLGQPPQSYQIHDHVIVLEQETRLLGIIVNEVHGVQDISTEMIEVASEYAGGHDTTTRLVTHLARCDEQTIMLLDDALLLGVSVERERSVRQLASSLPIHRWESSTGPRHTSGGLAASQFARTYVLSPDATPEEHEILYERARNLMSSLEQQESTQRAPLAIICMVLNPLDLLQSVRKRPARRSQEPSRPKSQLKHAILLVEDSMTTRTQETRILEGAGYEVVAAVNGVDALQMLSSRAFDAVVSDVQMPLMDGLTLTERIRREPKYTELPIVLVTSLATDHDKRRGIEVGANAYIAKPTFDQGLLLDTLRRLI